MNEEIMLKQKFASQGNLKPKQFYTEMFKLFAQDGQSISAIEFVKMCKLLKVYPVIIQFEYLKKVILKSPEYWHLKRDPNYHNQVSEIVSTFFSFKDFFKAFKIIARIGYKNIEETNQAKFMILTQFMKKQLDNYLLKNERSNYADSHSETRSSKNYDYSQQQYNAQQQQFQLNSQQNRTAMSPANCYFETQSTFTPSVDQQILDKRFSASELQVNYINSTLSNDYRGPKVCNTNMNISQQLMTNWRSSNSEVKSDISSRAFSTAVRSSKGKGIIIPKGNLKKKGNQMAVHSFLSMKQNFNTIQSKVQQSQKGIVDRKSLGSSQYRTITLKDGRNKSPSISRSMNDQQIIIEPVQVSKISNSSVVVQEPILKEDASQTSIRNEDSSQKSFRIRKFSRSSSKNSRASLDSARSHEDDDDKNINSACQTLESPDVKQQDIDKLTTDINLKPLAKKAAASIKDEVSTKYKKDRDYLAKMLVEIKGKFRSFASQVQTDENSYVKADTGTSYSEEVAKTLQIKDDRIQLLEEEIKRLKEREKNLLQELNREN